ncbi:MAG: UDP-glucuronic acid decarboxylase family protein [Candidatus Shapirobacteria bacterium]
MQKKILVTGCTGFIGSNQTVKLINQGHKVIGIDNLSFGTLKNLDEIINSKNFEFIKQDICDPINLKDIDEIFNFACPASPIAHHQDPIGAWKASTLGIYNLLEFAKKNNSLFFHTSTSEVYGDPQVHPQVETYRGNVDCTGLRACYKESKRAGESIIFDYNRYFKLPVRVIRIFNTYGPKMSPNDGRVVSNFLVQALTNKDITIYGDGSTTRSFQYVTDLLNGIEKMMYNTENFIGPVNIGNPSEFTIKQLAETVLKLIPTSKSKIIYLPYAPDDANIRKPDISLAKEKLNWQPVVELKEGLLKTIDYLKNNEIL